MLNSHYNCKLKAGYWLTISLYNFSHTFLLNKNIEDEDSEECVSLRC